MDMTENGGVSSSISSDPSILPDDIFPSIKTPFPSLPPSPIAKITKLSKDYQIVSSRIDNSENIHRLFRWAREALDFAESQPGLSQELIDTAVDVVKLIADSAPADPTSNSSSSSSTPSKFYGAANYTIGLWYLFGLFGYPINADIAMEKFLMAAKQGYSRALYRLGAFYESSRQISPALTYFEHGIRRKDASCYYRMAIAYLQGQLNKSIDTKRGLEYLERASFLADPDCSQAPYIYGLVQLGEINIPSLSESKKLLDREAGILALERSAWLGFGPALLRMGKAWQGTEKGYDPAVALRYFHIASRQDQYIIYKEKLKRVKSGQDYKPVIGSLLGVPEVEISKWMICGFEGSFSANEEWAFKFALMAAEQGNATGAFAVGYYYEVGIYVQSSLEKAISYYKSAADNGFEDAKARLQVLEKELQKSKENSNPRNTSPSPERASSDPFDSGVQRQLTRKDHERTISIRRKASVISSQKPKISVPELPSVSSVPLSGSELESKVVSEQPSSALPPPPPTIEQSPNTSKPLPQTPLTFHHSYSTSAYVSPPSSRSPSPKRLPRKSLTDSTVLDRPTPPPKENSHTNPFSFTSSPAATSLNAPSQFSSDLRRSPSPRRTHRYSSSIATDKSTSIPAGTLEARMNPRKVSSPVRAPILEETDKSTDQEFTRPLSISRAPSPSKPGSLTSRSEREFRNSSPIGVQATHPPLAQKRPSFNAIQSAPMLSSQTGRTVSGHMVTRMPNLNDEIPEREAVIDNEVLYRVVPLNVKKSSELLKRHSFVSEPQYQQIGNGQERNISPEPGMATLPAEPLKRKSIQLSPVPSPVFQTNETGSSLPGPLHNSPTLHHPDIQKSVRSYSSQPTLIQGEQVDGSTSFNDSTPTRSLRSSGSQPLLERLDKLGLEDSPPEVVKGTSISSSQSTTPTRPGSAVSVSPVPERTKSKSPIDRSPPPEKSKSFSFFSLRSSPKTPASPNSNCSSESGTPSQFSRTSTVSSLSTTITTSTTSSASASVPKPTDSDTNAAMPPPRIALTFDEMGIPVGTEDEKDCIIM